MNWIQEKNTSKDLGDSIKFELYAYGEGLRISIDEINWINPTQVIDKEHKFDVTVRKDGKIGQDFWIKEWGYLRFPSEVPKPEVPAPDINIEYKSQFLGYGSWMENQKEVLERFKSIYCSFIHSDFKDKSLVRCEFPAFGIVYNDIFIEDFDKGKRARPRVELYNENGELELLMDNDNYSTKKGVNDNNHVYYINIPKGRKRIVIINKENSDFPILAEVYRQGYEHTHANHEWGDNTILYPNERKEYFVDFTYKGLANELFKINCVTRW
jgi:hypothetical protein